MTILAAATASQPRTNKGWRLGSGLLVLLPLPLIALMLVAALDDDSVSAAGITGVDCAPISVTTAGVAGYSRDQITNAATIVAVGRQLNVPEQGWVVAIAAAMQESGLRNLDHGDRDSLGLFQERPSQGWGSPMQIMDPAYSATQFYHHLLAVPGWQAMSVNDAAQAVERSGFPDAYAPHEQTAREVIGAVQGSVCTPSGRPIPFDPNAQTVIDAALSQLGVPYSWGGGTAAGPSVGTGVDAGKVGFDCSGLAVFAYATIGVAVPHQTQAIWSAFQPAINNPSDVQPGDLLLLSNNGQPSGIHHVAIYLGNGQVIQAPESGQPVRITSNIWTNSYWSSQFIGAVRPRAA